MGFKKCKDGYNGNISLKKCPEPKQKPLKIEQDWKNRDHDNKEKFLKDCILMENKLVKIIYINSIIIGGEGKCSQLNNVSI